MKNPGEILSINDVAEQCGYSYFNRGRDYLVKHKVLEAKLLRHGPGESELQGTVTGSGRATYYQEIRLELDHKNRVSIHGSCSCPVAFNCKHVVAVCLLFIADRQRNPQVLQAVNPITPYLTWLEQLGSAAATTQPPVEWIAYLLQPGSRSGELTVSLKITRITKNGTVGGGRKVTWEHINKAFTDGAYVQAIDKEICELIAAQTYTSASWNQSVNLTGMLGHQILNSIVETGRGYWINTKKFILQPGEQRELNIDWGTDDQGHHKPALSVDGNALLMLTQPLMYVDPETGEVGPLHNADFNLAQIRLLLQAPTIPMTLRDDFSTLLTADYPEIPLAPPGKIEVSEIRDTAPIPVLTLHTGGMISLYFDYAGHAVSAGNDDDPFVIKRKLDVIRIHREFQSEADAISSLIEAWFEPTSTDFREHSLTFTDQLTLEGRHNSGLWFEFIEQTLPALESKGWRILRDDDFKLRIEEAEGWQASIVDSGTGNDWFEFRFDLEVDGHKLPLLPFITDLISDHDISDLPENFAIEVGDQHLLKIPSARLKPIVDTLLELLDQHPPAQNGAMTLSRFDAPRLNQLADQTDASWKGGAELRQFGEKLENFKGIEKAALPKGLHAELRPYQREGLDWLQFLRQYELGGILADDMGLGKTLQALAHLLVEKEAGRLTLPALIVAPTSLMGNWRREAERFTPDLSVLTLQGHERKQHFKKIKHHDIVLTTYPLLPRDGKVLAKQRYHSLILDEAQVIKNPKSKAAQLVRNINAQHRLCLTGTPMENHLGELWSLFDFLMPRFLGNQKTFTRVYRTPIEKHADQDRRIALSKRIAPFMLRRDKNEVATELPPKTEILRSVPLGDQQSALYESIRLTMEKKVRDSISAKGLGGSHITILDALLKLRQTCCDPRLLSLAQAKKVQESAKLDMLMEMLPEQLEEGRRILLFSQFTKMLGLIEQELKKRGICYSKLTGQTRKRDEAIEAFTSGEVPLFLISLKAGGVGLNLTEADTVIHYDPWWNPAVETQATDRAHRIGQDKPVFVYKLITEHSVEEKILDMQAKKRALADGIYTDNDQGDKPELSADDLKDLFTPLR